jgi:hypothetical protein
MAQICFRDQAEQQQYAPAKAEQGYRLNHILHKCVVHRSPPSHAFFIRLAFGRE